LRRLFLLVLIPVSCFFLSCAKEDKPVPDAETDRIILGFSQIGAESAWRTCNTRSVQDAAAAAGIQLLFDNAEQKQENQIKAIRSFIAYQVDVIAFVPIVSDGWENVLEEAREAKIPVLVCDRKINIEDEGLYAGYIGTDSEIEGRRAAEFLLNKYVGTDKKTIKIAEISGTEGSSAAVGRAAGFREITEKDERFEIVYSVSGDFLRSKGYELVRNFPLAWEDIDVLFSHNDGMTLGVIDALKEKGIEPGKDIVIVTVDAEQAAINALEKGEVNCVVECNPKQGPDIIRLASHLARGESIPPITLMIEEVFYEGEDLSDLPPRGY
jgi:simple sugar transport system substrate-binding protein